MSADSGAGHDGSDTESDTGTDVESVSFLVTEEDAGNRLDRVLVTHVPSIGRRAATELFSEGRVRVNGRTPKKGDMARAGATMTLFVPTLAAIAPEPGELDVLFERDDVCVVMKPAGMPTAPIRLGETGSLAGRVLARYPEIAGIGHRAREPGLLHRLDTQTSGVVVVARTETAFAHLGRALSEGRLEKRYLAVVSGVDFPETTIVRHRLGPDPRTPARVRIHEPSSTEGRASETRFSRVRSGGGRTLVEASASPAYRHQVRAHLAVLERPIVGDLVYGGDDAPGLAPGRHALHASYVAWTGDDVVRGFSARTELPADLGALLSD